MHMYNRTAADLSPATGDNVKIQYRIGVVVNVLIPYAFFKFTMARL
ncbi:MAG: hypothetical protein ACI9R3_003565 [Verrucomicrobiales bacterium]|jgi:hypothetical protein